MPSTKPDIKKTAFLIAALSITLGMGFSLSYGVITGSGAWVVPRDIWTQVNGAHYVANGALGYVYESDTGLVTLPMGAILLSPVAKLGEILDLTEGSPFPLKRPTMWLVLGPIMLGSIGFVSYSVGLLAFENGIRRARRLQAMAAIVSIPLVQYGHIEDIWALALVLIAIHKMSRNVVFPAALAASLAVGLKQWAVLTVPILIALNRPKSRVMSLVWIFLIPFLLAAFTLAVDWDRASEALLNPAGRAMHGHLAPWIKSGAASVITAPSRFAIVVCAVVIGVVVGSSGNSRVERAYAAAGLAVGVRMILEPVVHAYYLVPSLILWMIHDRLVGRSPARVFWPGVALMLAFAIHGFPILWWMGMVAASISIGLPSIRTVFIRAPRADTDVKSAG